ncbi:helix-turn-helix transcriptional regulator [Spongiactinospora sp. TRM90649]|uniref:helix-turn-helix domain-containing protein n=1 Tax=Spongiactinospora sp. TRM90649 TaxID=3031114 RepID=UPI0023F88AC2|nr:helix-turn-helix transcriptional regulator [Spongiactinospora sp. TRM90649]MDF5751556.1 helix-turn-helix transcriptional regulator [Spongiactinospora sp. TRM90649]
MAGRPPEPVDPLASPWHLLGSHIRYWRDLNSYRHVDVAKLAHLDKGDLSKWERGVAHPRVESVRALDELFGADNRLVGIYATVSELERTRKLLDKFKNELGQGITDRRGALRFATAAGIGGMLGPVVESTSWMLNAVEDEPRTVDEWERSILDHLHAIHTRPASRIRQELLIDLLLLREQIESGEHTAEEITELQRTFAVLGAFQASVLVRLDEFGPALRMYRAANRAADLSGDLDLRVRIRAHEAGHGLYGLRDPSAILDMTRSGERLAGDRPSVGRALLTATGAKALTLLGRHEEARLRLNALHETVDQGLAAVTGFWEPAGERVHFADAWVHAASGDESQLTAALDRLNAGRPDYQYSANSALQQALCVIVNGGVGKGAEQAATIIGELPPAYRNQMIMETGRRVLRAVPLDARRLAPVRDLRALLVN